MSTRCNVIIKFGDTKIRLYRHCDGYLTGAGQDVLDKLRQSEIRNTQDKGIINIAKLVQLFLINDYEYRLETELAGDLEYVYEINLKSEYSHGAHYNNSSLIGVDVFTRQDWKEDNPKNWPKLSFKSFDYWGDFQNHIDELHKKEVA